MPFHVALEHMRRHRDDGQIRLAQRSPQAFRCLYPIHARKADVHHHDVGSEIRHCLDGAIAGLNSQHRVACLRKNHDGNQSRRFVVLHHQNIAGWRGCCVLAAAVPAPFSRFARFAQRHRERKRAAGAGFGDQSKVGVDQLRELAADGKSQAGAADPPGYRSVNLRECLKNIFMVVGRDADARVGHSQAHYL